MPAELTDRSELTAEDVRSQRELEFENPAIRRYREQLGLTLEQAALHSRHARAARAARS